MEKRYFKEVEKVNNGEKDFRWFVNQVIPNGDTDWAFVLAARKIFLEDGGQSDKLVLNWEVNFPEGINFNTKF